MVKKYIIKEIFNISDIKKKFNSPENHIHNKNNSMDNIENYTNSTNNNINENYLFNILKIGLEENCQFKFIDDSFKVKKNIIFSIII